MKKSLRVFAFFVSLVMLLQPASALAAVEESDDGLLTYEEVKEIAKLEAPAINANKEIRAAWTNDKDDTIYPASFGGVYINDSKKLAVKLVDGNEQLREDILSIVSDDNVLVFENTDISLNELISIKEDLLQSLHATEIHSIGVSIPNSSVVIETYDSNQLNTTSKIKAYASHLQISEIAKSTEAYPTNPETNTSLVPFSTSAVTAYPGQRITYSESSKTVSATIGWYETDEQGNKFLLTAGHVVKTIIDNKSNVFVGNELIFPANNANYPSYYSYVYPGGSSTASIGDYGVIRCSNINLTNQLYVGGTEGYHTVTQYLENLNDLVVNQTVIFKGAGISGFHSAMVTGLYCTYFPDEDPNISINDVVRVQNTLERFAISGDSGSPIYMMNEKSEFILCGIYSGGSKENISVQDSRFYFTPMTVIVSNGLEPYMG